MGGEIYRMRKQEQKKELKELINNIIKISREYHSHFERDFNRLRKLLHELDLVKFVEFKSEDFEGHMNYIYHFVDSATDEVTETVLDIELDVSGKG